MRELPFFVVGRSEGDMGQIAEILPAHRLVFARRLPRRAAIGFSPNGNAGLIILGDSKQYATHVCYKRERECLALALQSGTPILGICHGAQLIAAYLEKRTYNENPLADLSKEQQNEHNGELKDVDFNADGRTDPVVRHLVGVRVTQAHTDAFQEPPGATGLAWSIEHSYLHCEAFRVGPPEAAVYGLQFHPEPTAKMLIDDQWFNDPPSSDDLQRAVKAGRRVIQAWVELATAREPPDSV